MQTWKEGPALWSLVAAPSGRSEARLRGDRDKALKELPVSCVQTEKQTHRLTEHRWLPHPGKGASEDFQQRVFGFQISAQIEEISRDDFEDGAGF